eukprot:585727-Rhodomonas_salina.1
MHAAVPRAAGARALRERDREQNQTRKKSMDKDSDKSTWQPREQISDPTEQGQPLHRLLTHDGETRKKKWGGGPGSLLSHCRRPGHRTPNNVNRACPGLSADTAKSNTDRALWTANAVAFAFGFAVRRGGFRTSASATEARMRLPRVSSIRSSACTQPSPHLRQSSDAQAHRKVMWPARLDGAIQRLFLARKRGGQHVGQRSSAPVHALRHALAEPADHRLRALRQVHRRSRCLCRRVLLCVLMPSTWQEHGGQYQQRPLAGTLAVAMSRDIPMSDAKGS